MFIRQGFDRYDPPCPRHREPLDAAVFSEVMFDHRRNISGEIPEHIAWIYSTAIPRLAALGVRVDVVRSEKDYLTLFHTVIGSGTHKGMLRGWLIGGKCCANRDLKIQPIHRYYGSFRKRGVVQYGRYRGRRTETPRADAGQRVYP